MGRVRLQGYLDVPTDRLAAIAAALPDHIALTQAEPGCLSFSVHQSPDEPRHFLVSEVFTDQAAFERHQARTSASPWAEATAGLARHYTITTEDASDPALRLAVPDTVPRRAIIEGEQGLAWRAGLGETLAGLEQDWGITIGQALPSGTAAFVAEAVDQAGESFIVKLSSPGANLGRHEATVLAAAAGKGYARLIRQDADRCAMLLERLGDRLADIEAPYLDKVDVICSTLLKAWMRAPLDGPYSTGVDKANSLATGMLKAYHQLGQPCSQSVLDTALMYCRDRAAAWRPQSAIIAHGHPHPGNILAIPGTDPQQFKFIDPDGLAIEPAYDLGVLLRGWDEGVSGRHAHDIARSHARHLTTRTQVPSEAIWQWGMIERVSTGLHLMELGDMAGGRQFLAVAEAIQQSS